MIHNEAREQAWERWSPRLTDLNKPAPSYHEAFVAAWEAALAETRDRSAESTCDLIRDLKALTADPPPSRRDIVPAAAHADLARRVLVALAACPDTAHRWVNIARERRHEITLTCSCGCVWKRIPFYQDTNIPICPDSRTS